MATPMTATQVKAQLKKWGVPYKEYKNWNTHNRAGHGAWGPVNGFIWHHTGSDGKSQEAFLYGGSAELPGPLVQMSIDQSGTVHLIGWGRCNHAGGGDPAVLQHVIDEDYSGILKPKKGNANGVDGNAHFYGVEIWYSGSHGMTNSQYTSALKLSAAILDFHEWTEKSVIAHGEWSNDKWDPGYAPGKMMDMNAVRNDVKAAIGHVNTGDVAVTVIKKTAGYKDVWDLDSATPPKGHETKENPSWAPISILTGAYEKADQALRNTEEILTLLKALGKGDS